MALSAVSFVLLIIEQIGEQSSGYCIEPVFSCKGTVNNKGADLAL
jgi:galactose mutarotase-like enzyme